MISALLISVTMYIFLRYIFSQRVIHVVLLVEGFENLRSRRIYEIGKAVNYLARHYLGAREVRALLLPETRLSTAKSAAAQCAPLALKVAEEATCKRNGKIYYKKKKNEIFLVIDTAFHQIFTSWKKRRRLKGHS